MADRSIRPTSSLLGHLPWRSGVTTSRSVRRLRCSWRRSWQSLRSSSGQVKVAGARGVEEDEGKREGGRDGRRPAGHLPGGPGESVVLFLFLSFLVRPFLSPPADLHVHHLAQIERGDLGGDEPV